MVLPFLEVLHLPSSSSFYSAVLQPLGLYYDYTSTHQQSGGSFAEAVAYGTNPSVPSGSADPSPRVDQPVLQIRQTKSPLGPLRPSSLTLSAPSSAVVAAFHACSLRANPALISSQVNLDLNHKIGSRFYIPGRDQQGPFGIGEAPAVAKPQRARRVSASAAPTHHYTSTVREVVLASQPQHRRGLRQGRNTAWLGRDENGDVCCITHDLDGNRLTVIHCDPRSPSSDYPDNPFIVTNSHLPIERSPVRILEWTFDETASSKFSRAAISTLSSSAPAPNPFLSSMSRQASVAPSATAGSFDVGSPRQSSKNGGLSTTTVVGAILGVAAGAAFTYGAMSRDKQPELRHVAEPRDPMPPALSRRSTYHEADRRSHYDDRRSMIEDMTPRKYRQEFPSRKIAYGDVIDDCENVWPPPRYLTEGSHHSTVQAAPSVAKSAARSRAVDDGYDRRSRASSKHHGSRSGFERSRSETPMERELFVAMEPEVMSKAPAGHRESYSRSHEAHSRYTEAPSRYTEGPTSAYTHARSRLSSHDPDRESYFSAKTQRTHGTARPPPSESRPPVVEYNIPYRSKPKGRASSASRGPTSGSQHRARSSSRGPSRVSARDIPLPTSGVGSSQANWDDDLESLAPSDSISCVGSKSSRRSRRHR